MLHAADIMHHAISPYVVFTKYYCTQSHCFLLFSPSCRNRATVQRQSRRCIHVSYRVIKTTVCTWLKSIVTRVTEVVGKSVCT